MVAVGLVVGLHAVLPPKRTELSAAKINCWHNSNSMSIRVSNQASGVQKLLNSVALLCERRLHFQEDIAPRFNLFRILGVEEKEVSTHSAFLAYLLNPSEGHAQGDLFLRQFLLELGHERLASFNGWVISKEVPFVGGRLDIVLQSAKARAIIVVENKVGTEDHATQLGAYRKWLDAPSRKRFFESRLLLYLTPRGDLAKNAPRNIYEPISYSGHITRWLSSCTVKPPRVGESIKTYLLTIRNLMTQTLMKDDLDDSIINLIKTPMERTAALRIARVGNLLKEQMLREIWDQGKAYLTKKLTEQKLTYWSLDRSEGSPLESGYEIRIVGKGVDNERPHPRFAFYQYATPTVFRWEFGVYFTHEKIRRLPEAKKLADVMEGSFSMPKKWGWEGYLLFTDDKKGIERTLEEEIAKEAGVSQFFETGWQKFQGLEPYLRRLHKTVLRM